MQHDDDDDDDAAADDDGGDFERLGNSEDERRKTQAATAKCVCARTINVSLVKTSIEGEITVHLIVRVHTHIPILTHTQHTHTRKDNHNGFVWKQMQWSEKSKLMPTTDRMNEIANHFTISESFLLSVQLE